MTTSDSFATPQALGDWMTEFNALGYKCRACGREGEWYEGSLPLLLEFLQKGTLRGLDHRCPCGAVAGYELWDAKDAEMP